MKGGAAAFTDALHRFGIVAILRDVDPTTLEARVHALHGAGIRMIEIALSDPDALPLVGHLAAVAPDDMLVGAGTVTSVALAREAHASGARFLVTPHVVASVLDFAREHDVGTLSGALTPTEIATVRDAGGRFVKLFPASAVGPGYVRALLGPYPDLELVPVGGVGSGNAAEFLAAGAVGLGVGGALASAPDDGRYAAAGAEAARLVDIWSEHRRLRPR